MSLIPVDSIKVIAESVGISPLNGMLLVPLVELSIHLQS